MREFSEVRRDLSGFMQSFGERLAALETSHRAVASLLSEKGSGHDFERLQNRVDAIDKDLSKIKDLLSQWRGAAVVIGIIWPLALQWIQKLLGISN